MPFSRNTQNLSHDLPNTLRGEVRLEKFRLWYQHRPSASFAFVMLLGAGIVAAFSRVGGGVCLAGLFYQSKRVRQNLSGLWMGALKLEPTSKVS